MTLRSFIASCVQKLAQWVAPLISVGVAAGFVVAVAQTIAGCAGNTFPLTGSTFFQVRQVSPGAMTFVTASTVSVNFVGSTVFPTLAIQNLTGPAIFVEGVLLFGDNINATPSSAFPVKQQIAGLGSVRGPTDASDVTNNLLINVPEDLGFAETLRTVPLGTGGTLPPNRLQSFIAIVLWKNSVGQDNFRPGVFDPVCFCYTTLPTLKTAGVEIIPTSNKTNVHFTVTYSVGTGSGGGAGGGG